MLSLQKWFVTEGWNTDYIAYAGVVITALVLAGIYRYLSGDDSAD